MNVKKCGMTALLILLLLAGNVGAYYIVLSNQGTDVYDKNGNLVSNGNLTVEIWDAPTGGNLVWNETYVNAIQNGKWNVMLGMNDNNPLNIVYGQLYWMDFKINGEDVDFTLDNGTVVERLPFVAPIGKFMVRFNGAALEYFDGTKWVSFSDQDWNYTDTVVWTYKAVGIGTTSPQAKLEVVGDFRFTDPNNPYRFYKLYFGTYNDFAYNATAMVIHPEWDAGGYDSSGVVYFSPDPHYIKVGIGTDNPQYRLDVAGDIRAISAAVHADLFRLTEGGSDTGFAWDYFPNVIYRDNAWRNATGVLVNGKGRMYIDDAGYVYAPRLYITEEGSESSPKWHLDYVPDNGRLAISYDASGSSTELVSVTPSGDIYASGDIHAGSGKSVFADYFKLTEGDGYTGWYLDYFPDIPGNSGAKVIGFNYNVSFMFGVGTDRSVYIGHNLKMARLNDGDTTWKRALVVDPNDWNRLIINYNQDFSSGVRIFGPDVDIYGNIDFYHGTGEGNIYNVDIIRGYNDIRFQLGDNNYKFEFLEAGGATKAYITSGGDLWLVGKLGTNSFDPNNGYPSGWTGGIHTWDIYAEGSIGLGQGGGLNAVITSAGNAWFLGNVGIGTNNPAYKLHVVGGQVAVESGDIVGYNIISDTDGGKKWFVGYDPDKDYFYIDEVGVARHLVIKNGGNVGIGTDAPYFKLHVESDGASSIAVETTDASSSAGYFIINSGKGRYWFVGYDPTYDYFCIDGMGVLGGTPLVITMDGNVGIGTDNPQYRLDVAGDVRVKGRIGTNGYDPNSGYPEGWGGGIHTWDIYAEGSVGIGRYGKLTVVLSDNNDAEGYIWFNNTNSNQWAQISRWADRLEIASSDAIGFAIGGIGSTVVQVDSGGINMNGHNIGNVNDIYISGGDDAIGAIFGPDNVGRITLKNGEIDINGPLYISGDIHATNMYADYFWITEGGSNTGWHLDYFPDNGRLGLVKDGYGEVMSWLPNGYVGIGTTGPAYKLHVVGGQVAVESGDIVGYNIISDTDGGKKWFVGYDPNNDYFFIDEVGVGRHLIIKNGGNVGIGTTPDSDHKLVVNGNVDVRGNLNVNRLIVSTISLSGVGLIYTDNLDIVLDPDGGDVYVDGRVHAWDFIESSSIRFKTDVRPLAINTSLIYNLTPVSFRWKDTGEEDFGLIAEDVAEIIPELVGFDENGTPVGIKYNKLAVLMLPELKKHEEKIKELEKELQELKAKLKPILEKRVYRIGETLTITLDENPETALLITPDYKVIQLEFKEGKAEVKLSQTGEYILVINDKVEKLYVVS